MKANASSENGRVAPDMWLAGYCQAHRCSLLDAVRWWAYQCQLEEQEQAEAATA